MAVEFHFLLVVKCFWKGKNNPTFTPKIIHTNAFLKRTILFFIFCTVKQVVRFIKFYEIFIILFIIIILIISFKIYNDYNISLLLFSSKIQIIKLKEFEEKLWDVTKKMKFIKYPIRRNECLDINKLDGILI